MLASSSRRETYKPENAQAKKVGCMSGIFYFLHMHRQHSRKRLSAGKKVNSTGASPPAKAPPPPPAPHSAGPQAGEKPKPPQKARDSDAAREGADEKPGQKARTAASSIAGSLQSRRLSCDVASRSPTLPSEIRRSNSGGSPRKTPALVARLMGLDDDAPPALRCPESAVEKRRKLLGALERCDEDLRALKKIIEALRVTESRKELGVRKAEPMHKGAVGCAVTPKHSGGGESSDVEKRCLEVDGEQPSPVSVLDVITSPPARRRPNASATAGGNQRRADSPPVRSKLHLRTAVASSSLLPANSGRHGNNAPTVDGHHLLWSARVEAMPMFAGRTAEGPFGDSGSWQKKTASGRPWRLPCSRAMVESVDEVWADGVWEERWELGKVGVALEGGILGDLVAEMVKELGFPRCSRLPLPFDACRKRLCF